jgi:hypothetical protein
MNRRNFYRILGTATAVRVILTAGAPAYAAGPMILSERGCPRAAACPLLSWSASPDGEGVAA